MNKSMWVRVLNIVMVGALVALAACTPTAEATQTVTPYPEVPATATVQAVALAPAATPVATPDASRQIGDELAQIGDELAVLGDDAAQQTMPVFMGWAREESGVRAHLGAEADETFRRVDEAQAAMAQELIGQLEAGVRPRGMAVLFPPRSSVPSGLLSFPAYLGIMDVFMSLIHQGGGHASSAAEPQVIENQIDKEIAEGITGDAETKITLMGSYLEADVKITVAIEKDGKRYEEVASGTLRANVCPDEQGLVPVDMNLEITGHLIGGGGFTMAFTGQAVGHVDDEANLATVEEEFEVEMTIRQVNTWPFGGESTESAKLSFRNVATGLILDKDSTRKITGPDLRNGMELAVAKYVAPLAMVTVELIYDTARREWQSGCCVAVVVEYEHRVVGTGGDISFTATVHHKFEDTDLAVPVVATMDSGAGSVTPADTRVPAPATFVYTAPDETGEAKVKLVSRSRRGIGELKVGIEIQDNYYRVDSFIGLYSQVPLKGSICDPEQPFTWLVEGKNPSGGEYVGDIKFTPTDAESGSWVHTATSEVGGRTGTVSGSGTYVLQGFGGDKPILSMAATTAKSEVDGYVAAYEWPAWQVELTPAVGTCWQW